MDLTTDYMGLSLKHPVVASASPLSETVKGIRELEAGGAAAVVLFSLFEEQIRREDEAAAERMEAGAERFSESLSYFPDVDIRRPGPEEYLDLLRRAAETVDIPLIASLNGATREGWVEYARQMQDAGASALELNIYAVETDLERSGAEVEDRHLEILQAVKASVSIPVSLKLSPFFSAIGGMAARLSRAGADGLVLFNRFYQPDIDIVHLEVAPTLSLSSAAEIRLPLLWTALLHGRIEASLAASRGVEGPDEVIKYLLAGADVVMTTSALLRHGPAYARALTEGLKRWMEPRGFSSVDEVKGVMSHARVADPGAFERANYLQILESYGERGPGRG